MSLPVSQDVPDSYSRFRTILPKRPWRVVIADDEVLPTELLKRYVMRLGHTVAGSARNGAEAVALVRELQPDVVVMDLRMPVMDGWTAMAEVTRDMLSPIVVVSALDDRESLKQAVAAGASAFLTQPVREDDLERALELAIARFADLQEIHNWRADAERRASEQASQPGLMANTLSQLRETELLLVNAARRAAVASLAQGLAHEINNELTPIMVNAEIMGLMGDGNPELLRHANQIIEHVRRIAGWTASFRQLTSGGTREAMPFSFNGVVREALGMYADRIQRAGIVAQIETDSEMPVMYGHPDQIQEVLMNLIQNSVEAQPNGGMLEISTRYEPEVSVALLTLSDAGGGIRPELLEQVFEAGFTTKGTNEQNIVLGWGLFTARQIVQAHGGTIEISSPAFGARRGITVVLKLPLGAESRSVRSPDLV